MESFTERPSAARMKLAVYGPPDEGAVAQLDRCIATVEDVADDIAAGVLCADHHLGYSMPIGGVLATKHTILPAGVGYDIACGNYAVETDIPAADVPIASVMDEIWARISFGVGRKNQERVDHPVIDRIAHAEVVQQRGMAEMAAAQLGTVGSGNHYVDLFRDRDTGRLWVGVHFGSRGFGHKTACGFLALAAGKEWAARVSDDMHAPPTTIDARSNLGEAYLAAMQLAGDYAYAGREWVVGMVLEILGAGMPLQTVHNHHNFAWIETHGDEDVLVTRKGATPAFPGQRGFVGGSMGEDAVILEGVASEASARTFYSTVHGAGRVMSRTKAAGKVKRRKVWACGQRDCAGTLPIQAPLGPGGANPLCPVCGSRTHRREASEQLAAGVVDWPEVQARLKAQGIELRGGGADEAPECYKRLDEVLAYHGDTVRVVHRLQVLGVAMAGRETFDPYRD